MNADRNVPLRFFELSSAMSAEQRLRSFAARMSDTSLGQQADIHHEVLLGEFSTSGWFRFSRGLQQQALLQLALKAQSNGRATLEALINAKQPKQVAFVRQANVAHTQQVNNGVASSHVGNEAKTPNELTVEQAHGG